MTHLIQKLERNTQGIDYVCGDVHGCHDLLFDAFITIGGDLSKDRLIVAGDLVDRNPQSREMLWAYKAGMIYSTLGNHDYGVVQHHIGDPRLTDIDYLNWGGAWCMGMFPEERQEFVDLVQTMPLVIEIDTPNGKVGVVHADIHDNDWDLTLKRIEDAPDIEEHLYLIWNRRRVENELINPVKGLHRLVVGHTYVPKPTRLANVLAVDTGAWAAPDGIHPRSFTFYNTSDDEFVQVVYPT